MYSIIYKLGWVFIGTLTWLILLFIVMIIGAYTNKKLTNHDTRTIRKAIDAENAYGLAKWGNYTHKSRLFLFFNFLLRIFAI